MERTCSLELVVFEQVTCSQHCDFVMKLCPHSAFINVQLIGQISLLPSILTPEIFSPTYNLSLIVSLRLGGIRGIIDTYRLCPHCNKKQFRLHHPQDALLTFAIHILYKFHFWVVLI